MTRALRLPITCLTQVTTTDAPLAGTSFAQHTAGFPDALLSKEGTPENGRLRVCTLGTVA